MSDDLSATVTDDRFPGWQARLIHDDCAGEPDGDALAPALLVPSRGRPKASTCRGTPNRFWPRGCIWPTGTGSAGTCTGGTA